MECWSQGERVIIETRYGGTYEGGLWAAFASPNIPDEAQGDDVECGRWWENPTVAAGTGSTPDEALEALEEAVRGCQHPGETRTLAPVGFICGFCNRIVQPTSGTVEDLLTVMNRFASDLIPLNLHVPRELSLRGNPIEFNEALPLLVEAASAEGMTQIGITEEPGGRTVHFRGK